MYALSSTFEILIDTSIYVKSHTINMCDPKEKIKK